MTRQRFYYERGRPVEILTWPGPGRGPRNVLVRRDGGELTVRPFRGLRRQPPGSRPPRRPRTTPARPAAPAPVPGGVIGRHLEHLRLRGRAATTRYARRRASVRMQNWLPVPLLEATHADLRDWRAGLELAPCTVCAYVSHAVQFYAWALAEDLIPASPAKDLPVPWPGRRLPRPIAETDLLAALETAPRRIRPMLVLAAWAGLRAKEIALLRRENVLDSTPQPVIIVAQDATKGRTERIVPMSTFVLAELRPVLGYTGWVFPRHDGQDGPNTPGLVSKLCCRHLHDCGISATLHQLRHRFGTQTYRVSKDLRAVQEMLGHGDPATTAGYAAYEMENAAAAVEAIPAPRHLQIVAVVGHRRQVYRNLDL